MVSMASLSERQGCSAAVSVYSFQATSPFGLLSMDTNNGKVSMVSGPLYASTQPECVKITNPHQPGHKFLDQLINKPPMCLVNEICRHHNLRHESILLHTTGPDHSKRFTVSLRLGNIEQFIGEGTSIRAAQRNAAIYALQTTKLSFPQATNRPAVTIMTLQVQTPASELNTVLMKKGIQPKYEMAVEHKSSDDCVAMNLVNNNHHQYATRPTNMAWPQPVPCSRVNVPPNYSHHKDNSHNYNMIGFNQFSHLPYPFIPIHQMNSNFSYPQALLPYPPNFPPFQPSYPQSIHMFPNRNNFSPQFNYGYNPGQPYNNFYQAYKPIHKLGSVMRSSSNNVQLNNHKNSVNYEAKVEFDGKQFTGHGPTAQAARHSAANEALNFIKKQQKNENCSDKQISISTNSSEQSPISLVYELASKTRHNVKFEVVSESGQVHVPLYKMCCSLYTENSAENPFICSIGEDRSKKAAKKAAAENMLLIMKEKSVFSNFKKLFFYLSSIQSKSQILESETAKSSFCHHPNSSETKTSSTLNNANIISCKNTTLLYQLARDLLINNPTFHLSTIDKDNQLYTNYLSMFAQREQKFSKLYMAECVLLFDQRLPQLTCSVMSVGFGSNQRMAKSIAAYICLSKIGFKPYITWKEENEQVDISLEFSLKQNINVAYLHSKIITTNNDLELEKSTPDDVSLINLKDITADCRSSIEQNLQFLIHVLGKVYLFALKDNSKPINRIFMKLESTLNAFFSNKYSDLSSEYIQEKCTYLKEEIAKLDLNKYWSHLLLLSSLVSLGSKMPTKQPILSFKSHQFDSETKESTDSKAISIVSSQCSYILSHIFNFTSIKNNVCSYGLGTTKDEAQEVASLWMLKKLAYMAKKQMIENEFENEFPKPLVKSTSNLSSNVVSPHSITSVETLSKSKSKSRPSQGQVTSKQCISTLYQVCSDLNIHKPTFESRPWQAQSEDEQSEKLFFVECVLFFSQDFGEQLSTKLIVCAIAPSQRMARTISAYIILNQIGFPSSMQAVELRSTGHFETYLQKSLKLNSNLIPLPNSLLDRVYSIDHRLLEANRQEVEHNLNFLIHILQSIYRPFLKNHKMSSPAHLVSRIESELFEYHNKQQQIMDQSSTFDRCSAHIQQCISNFLQTFDSSQFWHHLQMLSSIVSLLTGDLTQTLSPPVLEFKCHYFTSVSCTEDNNHSVQVAFISVHSNLPSLFKSNDILSRPLMGFALSQNEQTARELVSYKVLRHLAIHLWK